MSSGWVSPVGSTTAPRYNYASKQTRPDLLRDIHPDRQSQNVATTIQIKLPGHIIGFRLFPMSDRRAQYCNKICLEILESLE